MMKAVRTSKNGSVHYDSRQYIVLIKFHGVIADEDYKQAWRDAVEVTFEFGAEKIIIDQSGVEQVGLKARAWVVMKIYPQIKRDLSPDLAVAVITSSDTQQRSGVQYLIKAAQAISGYSIAIVPDQAAAVAWLNEQRPV
jgi:hypothetical protein